MFFEEKIIVWLNESHPKVRLVDNRDDRGLWESELINVEAAKDDDESVVTVLNFKNGYSLRLIHTELPKPKTP